jgi:mono/diheme cytochrome c family protein
VRAPFGVALLALILAFAGCGDDGGGSPLADRGRQIYLSQCTTCHGPDPSTNGPVGPAIRGSSRDLLESKVLKGAYPPGYTPKRPTQVMPPQPQLAPDIAALAEFLR